MKTKEDLFYKQEWIAAYCREKNRLIRNLTSLDMFSEEDYEEVRHWQEPDVDKVLQGLPTVGDKSILGRGDVHACPWCLLHDFLEKGDMVCGSCEYGKRHGQCTDETMAGFPLYKVIVHLLRKIPKQSQSNGGIITFIREDLDAWLKKNPKPDPDSKKPWELNRVQLMEWYESMPGMPGCEVEKYLEEYGHKFDPGRAKDLLRWLYDIEPGDIVEVGDNVAPSGAVILGEKPGRKFFLYVDVRQNDDGDVGIQVGYPISSGYLGHVTYTGQDGHAGLFIFFIKGNFKNRYRKGD